MTKEISEQIELAATAEYEHQKKQDEYNKMEQTRKLRNRLQTEHEESKYRLDQLKGQHTHLLKDNKQDEELLKKEMLEKAKTDLKAEHQSRILQLQKEKQEKDNQIFVSNEMLDYIQSPENQFRVAQSEVIALRNEVRERDARIKKELETKIERHQRLSIGQAVARYSEEKKIPMGEIMNNIGDHLPSMDMPEAIKPYVVEQAINYTEEELNQRRGHIEALSQKFLHTFQQEDLDIFKTVLTRDNYLCDLGNVVDPAHLCSTSYDRLVASFEYFWHTRRGQTPIFE
jgi:hypothetical protein